MSQRIRSDFGTLADRTGARPVPDRVTAQHVWLDGDVPGLLVRWRRQGAAWSGLVCHLSAVAGEPVAEWVEAGRITPVTG